MKLMLIVLVLANAMVYAWLQWGQSPPPPTPTELHPELIRVVPQALQAKAAAKPAVSIPTASPTIDSSSAFIAPTPHPNTAPLAPTTQPTNPVDNTNTCLLWGPIAALQVATTQTQLNTMGLRERLIVHDDPSAKGPFWVFYPPLLNKQAADAKLASLVAQGITDINVVRNGPWQNALSLGLYGKAELADQRVTNLNKQGIHAQIEAHGNAPRSFSLQTLTHNELTAVYALQHALHLPDPQRIPCSKQ